MSPAPNTPESIVLEVGQRHVVTLPGLGTAGYRWSAGGFDAEIVRVEQLLTMPGTVKIELGKSIDERFSIVALAPGQTTVHFSQARSFEKSTPPRATRDLEVQVKASE